MAEAIEQELTRPIEEAAKALEGLMNIDSKSGGGQSLVSIRTTGEFSRQQTVDKLAIALDQIADFPPEGSGPLRILLGDAPTTAQVQVDVSGEPLNLHGRVVRMGGQLGSMSRFAEVILEVDTTSIAPELQQRVLPGLFAQATLEGRTLSEVTPIPRSSGSCPGTITRPRSPRS